MTTLDQPRAPAAPVESSRRAWIAIALTPVGLLLSVAVGYAVAGLIGVTLDPATGPGPTIGQNFVVWSIGSLCWFAPPVAAIVLARRPASARNRAARAALAVGGLLVGIGTSVSGGCSTGHGLSGCSRLQPAGVAATATFFATAVAASLLLDGVRP